MMKKDARMEAESDKIEREIETKLQLDIWKPIPHTREGLLNLCEKLVDKLLLIDTFPDDYKLNALTWVMGQLLGVIAGNIGYTPTSKFNGHRKWIIEFEKDAI